MNVLKLALEVAQQKGKVSKTVSMTKHQSFIEIDIAKYQTSKSATAKVLKSIDEK